MRSIKSQADLAVAANPQYVAEFVHNIYALWLKHERETLANCHYMEQQPDITEKMRAILIDWLVEVHLKFKLLPETLYLTVNLIDRFLEQETIPRGRLQLVGVTCMLIACKYEEIYPPIVKDFVYITDNAYTHQEILKMEQKILTALDFNIQITSTWRFFERFEFLQKPGDFERNFAQYLIEGCLIEYAMLKYTPSTLAASALYFAAKMVRKTEPWSKFMVDQTRIKENELRSCAKDMLAVLRNMSNNENLKAVQNKFALPKYGKVSSAKIEKTAPPKNEAPSSMSTSNTGEKQQLRSLSQQPTN